MHEPTPRRLALVPKGTGPEGPPDEARPEVPSDDPGAEIADDGLAAWLIPHPGREPPIEWLPFAVRLTMIQILEVAGDALNRAELLADVASSLDARSATFIDQAARSEQIRRRVDSLQRMAFDLHALAVRIMGQWAEPESS